jgi:hypothetical protein
MVYGVLTMPLPMPEGFFVGGSLRKFCAARRVGNQKGSFHGMRVPENFVSSRMEKSIQSRLDLVVKCIPLFSGYLIFLGVLTEIAYYLLFNITICSYISLSETILFSIQPFIEYGVVLAVTVSVLVVQRKVAKGKNADEQNSNKKLQSLASLYKLMYLISILFILVALIISVIKNAKYDWYFFACVSATILVAVAILYSISIVQHVITVNERLAFGIIAMTYMFTLAILWVTVSRGLDTKYLAPKYYMQISMKENRSLKTSDSLIYVGKSEKYLFLYDKKIDAPEILSSDDIIGTKWVRK